MCFFLLIQFFHCVANIIECNGPASVTLVEAQELVVRIRKVSRILYLVHTLFDKSGLQELRFKVFLNGLPSRLCFGAHKQHLYIADNEVSSGKPIAGRVVVFSVQ